MGDVSSNKSRNVCKVSGAEVDDGGLCQCRPVFRSKPNAVAAFVQITHRPTDLCLYRRRINEDWLFNGGVV